MVSYAFKSRIFPLQPTKRSGNLGMSDHVAEVSDSSHLKILTPKQMLQRLAITLAQVKAGNISKNLLNQICQIIYSLYRAKDIHKKLRNNIMIKLIKQNGYYIYEF